MPGIKLEPHETFKKAIVGRTKKGFTIYSYVKLVEIYKEMNGWNNEECAEWIDYNVESLTCMGLKIRYPRG